MKGIKLMEKVNKNSAQIAYECFYDSLKQHGVDVDNESARKMCDHFMNSMRERDLANKIKVHMSVVAATESPVSPVTGFSVGQVVTLTQIENSSEWILRSISPKPMDMTSSYMSVDRKMIVRFEGNATTGMILPNQ